MSIWKKYRHYVESILQSQAVHHLRGVEYWRDRLFVTIVVYMLPVSMVAYVPAMAICIYYEELFIAIWDNVALAILAILTLSRNMTMALRKQLLVGTLYLLSGTLLYYLGVYGPGLLYLLSTVIFVSLIYSTRLAFACIAINTVICLLFALGLELKVMESAANVLYNPGAWLGVASNHILLSIVFAVAIHILVNGFAETLKNEIDLRQKLVSETVESAKMVKELKLKNQELEQFAYIASHDLQEPLNSISGIVELLKLEGITKKQEEYHQSLAYISTSVHRLRSLIRGLLDYSRIGRHLNWEKVNCRELIEQVANDLQASISQSRARIVIDQSIDKMPELMVFKLDFNQLFQNLISNAIKFRKNHITPEIVIRVSEDDKCWRFSVEDNGIGIPAVYKDKIFVIFKRVHSDQAFEGNGIGLAFCKKIVETHGGSIWVESEPGAGSKFHFTIPMHNG